MLVTSGCVGYVGPRQLPPPQPTVVIMHEYPYFYYPFMLVRFNFWNDVPMHPRQH